MAGAFVQSAFQYMCPVLCTLYRYIIAPCIESNVCITRIITNVWGCEISQFSELEGLQSSVEFSIRVSISIQTQKWEIWDTHFGSLECPFSPSHIYRKDVRKVYNISVLGFFCYLNDLPCPFTFLGSTTMRRMSSYESSGVDFFLILFHQCSRLLQFALDDRRNKNFSGVGRMNVLLRQERYDVCRIHLNKEKKGSEKLFFFFSGLGWCRSTSITCNFFPYPPRRRHILRCSAI